MLLNIGIGSNAGVYSSEGGPFFVMRDFFGALTPGLAKASMGDGYPQMVLTVVTMFVGLFLIVLFAHKKVKGSVLLGMLCASGIYWAGEAIFLHTNPFAALKGASFVPAFGDMAATTLFKFDFAALGQIGWFTVVTLVITFCIIDMFDTIGTLVCARRCWPTPSAPSRARAPARPRSRRLSSLPPAWRPAAARA